MTELSPATRQIALLGVATAAGASVRGAGMGPEALRVAGLVEALLELGHEVTDHGDLRRPHLGASKGPASWRLPEERRADVLQLSARASDDGLAILEAETAQMVAVHDAIALMRRDLVGGAS